MTLQNPKTIRSKLRYPLAITAGFVTFATAVVLWEQLQLPRWAWLSEHRALAAEFHESQLTQAQLKYYTLDREIKKYEQEGLIPPESLIREWQNLKLRIRDLCTKLKKDPECAESS
jgi:hypothetical protein